MTSRKRRRNDENTPLRAAQTLAHLPGPFINTFGSPSVTHTPPVHTPPGSSFQFLDGFTPVPKKRKIARNFTADDLLNVYGAQTMREEAEAEREEAEKRREEHEADDLRKDGERRLNEVLRHIENDPLRSSQVSRMLVRHGNSIFDSLRKRQPQVANDWAISTVRNLIASEGDRLAQHFKPEQNISVSEILKHFSMPEFLTRAEVLAPSTCQVLRQIGFPETSSPEKSKKQELILATTICMLAKCRNDHATEFQTSMGMYFLACGTSRSLFDVLSHAGLTVSYPQAISKLKQLSEERLAETRLIAKTRAFMLIWDNLNIAFKVSEQRHNSKDHFDNGTTATLVPLYGVEYGTLPLNAKRTRWRPILTFGPEDLLPTREEAERVQAGQLWHIKDILYDAFPSLRTRLGSSILPPPAVQPIPVHKTEQYPLPAMHIDESSLEGTLSVMNTIFRNSLDLTETDIKSHGLVICAGDQLSLALLDKVHAFCIKEFFERTAL